MVRPDEQARSSEGMVRIPEQPAGAPAGPPRPFEPTAEHPNEWTADSPFDGSTPPVGTPVVVPAPAMDADQPAELIPNPERFRAQLRELQADFLDDPERSVREVQRLLAEATAALTEAVAEHGRVIDESSSGDTENLRITLLRYRSTLERLLAV